jgi:hypothetical protein
MASPRKYELPPPIAQLTTQAAYERWLRRRARAHVGRDRNRENLTATIEKYKVAIHRAVKLSEGRDFYTGEALNWRLLSQYNNAESKAGGRVYKAKLALMPSVDHVGDGRGVPEFRICAWRTNDAKSDLTQVEFVDLCRKVVEHTHRPRSGADERPL